MATWTTSHENAFSRFFAQLDTGAADREMIETSARENAGEAAFDQTWMIGTTLFGHDITGTQNDAMLIGAIDTAKMLADQYYE